MTWAAFVQMAYCAVRDWGMQPSEFWAMSPQEFWWEFDDKLKTQRKIEKARSGGKPTEDEWEAAIERHRERRARGEVK